MSDELKEVKELKELKTRFIALEGKLDFSELFRKEIKEALVKELASKVIFPAFIAVYGKDKPDNFIFIMRKGIEEGDECIFLGENEESIKKFYLAIKKALKQDEDS